MPAQSVNKYACMSTTTRKLTTVAQRRVMGLPSQSSAVWSRYDFTRRCGEGDLEVDRWCFGAGEKRTRGPGSKCSSAWNFLITNPQPAWHDNELPRFVPAKLLHRYKNPIRTVGLLLEVRGDITLYHKVASNLMLSCFGCNTGPVARQHHHSVGLASP